MFVGHRIKTAAFWSPFARLAAILLDIDAVSASGEMMSL